MEALLIVAVLVGLFAPVTYLTPANLADFERLQKKLGIDVYVVDTQGLERVGRLAGADATTLRLSVSAGEMVLTRADVVEVDRRRDSSLDGTIKGAVFGLLVGIAAFRDSPGFLWRGVVVYGGIGFALDAAQNAREPLYRAPRGPTVTVTW